MPWTVPFTRAISSPAPAEASSPTASPASSPSAPSSSRTTPAASSPCAGPEWRSGTTCGPSAPTTPTAPEHFRGSAQMPGASSSPAASRARTSAPPEKGRASPRASARVCGASLPASFARYDPPTHSWRIPQCLFQGDLSLFSATWPRSGILLDGTCYPLPPWAPATNANESGSPASAPPLFPTVTINGNGNFKGASAKSGDGLFTVVKRLDRGSFPTPCSHDAMAQGPGPNGWQRNGHDAHRKLNVTVVRLASGRGGGNGRRPTPATGRTPAPRREAGIAPISEPPSTIPPHEVPVAAEPRLPERADEPARMGEDHRPAPAQPQRLRAFPTPRVHDATHDGPSELARHAPNLATLVRLEQ